MRPDILGKKKAGKNGEVPLDGDAVRDLFEMYRNVPVLVVARKAFLSKVLAEPFTFSIPKLGITSTPEVGKVINAFWMPWLRQCFDWIKIVGVVPYMFVSQGDHMIPFIPDISLGYISVYVTDTNPPRIRYKWHYTNSTKVGDEEKNMLWIITEGAPDANGNLRSALASLLPNYRSLLKLRNAQDIASTQAARPVHVIESNPSLRTATDDGLARLTADFDKAAGIGQARRERMQQAQLRVKQSELYRNLRENEMANRQRSTVQQTMWTDTPQDVLEEMDAGFSNRVVALGEHYKYTTAARPQLVADYNKAESQFNLMASAVMDFALELLTPTGSSRSQNIKGAEQYENERIREQSTFFESILQPAIVIAYRKEFQRVMDDARHWRISRLGGDPNNVSYLYPELDVVVDLSNTTVTGDEEMRSYWMDGIISKETYAKHVLRNKNVPLELMQLSMWPDQYPKELLVKGGGEKSSSSSSSTEKPKKKRERPASEKAPPPKDTTAAGEEKKKTGESEKKKVKE